MQSRVDDSTTNSNLPQNVHALPRATIHIGLPKSGSTAFQQSLQAARLHLSESGIRTLVNDTITIDADLPTRALNLAAAVIRPNIDAWFRIVVPETQLANVVRECEASVQRQAQSEETCLVASMEDLCLIRTKAEVEQLQRLLAPRVVHVVLVLRENTSYRRSVKYQLARAGLRTWSPFPESCLNTAKDSWIFDQSALIEVLRDVLEPGAVTVVDYEGAVASEGSIVPTLWRACGLPESVLSLVHWQHRWSNVSPSLPDVDLEGEENIEALRDYAWRLKAQNNHIQLSFLWRLTRPMGRLRRNVKARLGRR